MRIKATIMFLLACAPIHLFAQPAQLVKDIFNLPAAAGSNPQKFAQVGSTIFFAASDTANGTELWKTDGTTAGTMLVRDIQLGPNSSVPDCLQAYQGKLIFSASEEAPERSYGKATEPPPQPGSSFRSAHRSEERRSRDARVSAIR